MMERKNILIIYALKEYPTRNMTSDLLYSFKRHSNHRIFYYNRFINKLPEYLRNATFDAIIFHQSVTFTCDSRQWKIRQEDFKHFLEGKNCIKVALFQDEYVYTDLSVRFLNECEIDYAYTVAPQSEWNKIYRGLNKKTKIMPMLTGYIERKPEKYYESKLEKNRTIDVGYRAVWDKDSIVLGRFGYDKIRIADAFRKALKDTGVKESVRVGSKYIIKGKRWNDFLSSCRYILGVESGASALDNDGSIYNAVKRAIENDPDISVEQLYNDYVQGKDETFKLRAISPRHFEAIEEGACQILYEGEYSGVLRPGVHYIPLKKDHSNLIDIINQLDDEERRKKIVKTAYEEIVKSGRYTYDNFVRCFFNDIFAKYSNVTAGKHDFFDTFRLNILINIHEIKIKCYVIGIQTLKKCRVMTIIRKNKLIKKLMEDYHGQRI